jgi:putative oxidoreductase
MTPKSRLYIPALGGIYDSLWNFVELILRVGAGLLLVPHGLWKLGYLGGPGLTGVGGFLGKFGYVPSAFWAIVLTIVEIIGGILLTIGLFTRPVALIALIEMLFIIQYHWRYGWFFNVQGGGMEFAVLWAAALLYFAIRGGGSTSVDARMSKEF